MSNEIVPGPEKKVSERLNWPSILAFTLMLLCGLATILGFIHIFLGLSEHLQDKLLEEAPTLWPLMLPLFLSAGAAIRSFFLGPMLHPKQ